MIDFKDYVYYDKNNKADACGYLRFSSENQRDGYSIEAQERAVLDYCRKNQINMVKFYIDEAKSATNDNRPNFLNMIDDSANKDWSIAIVHKLDRFARDRYDSIIYRKKLKDNGVKLISVLENLDEDSPEDIILLSVLEGMNEYYSKNLSRETKKGMTENAYKGRHNGGIPPLGFVVNKDTKMLEIEPAEAEIVKQIFELYSKGETPSEICRIINEQGFRTKAKKVFLPSTIRSMLCNEKYIGTYFFRKTKHVKTSTGSVRRPQEESDLIVIENIIPRIIDEDTWIICQRRINATAHPSSRAKVEYYLRGLMFCAECGSPYVGGGSVPSFKKKTGELKRYYCYICSNKRKNGAKACKCGNVGKERIERAVINAIVQYCYNDSSIDMFADEFIEYCKLNDTTNRDERNKLQQELKKAQQQKDRIISLAVDGILSYEETKEQKLNIDSKIKLFKEKLDVLKRDTIPTKKEIVSYMKDTRKRIENDAFDDYESLIKQHVHKIIVHNDYQEIILTTLSKNIYDQYGNIDLDLAEKSTSDSEMSAPANIPLSLIELASALTIRLILQKGQKVATLL